MPDRPATAPADPATETGRGVRAGHGEVPLRHGYTVADVPAARRLGVLREPRGPTGGRGVNITTYVTCEHFGGTLLVDVSPEGWDHPIGEPLGTRLRMEVDAATLDVDAQGRSTGWVWLRGRRLLPGGSARSGKALVRLSALPGDLRIRHQGAVVEAGELQQTHSLGRRPDTGEAAS